MRVGYALKKQILIGNIGFLHASCMPVVMKWACRCSRDAPFS